MEIAVPSLLRAEEGAGGGAVRAAHLRRALGAQASRPGRWAFAARPAVRCVAPRTRLGRPPVARVREGGMNGTETSTAVVPRIPPSLPLAHDECIWIRCPQCSMPLGPIRYDSLASESLRVRCSTCSFFLAQEDGIWN